MHVTDTDTDFDDVTVSTPAGPRTITTTAHHLFWDVTTGSWSYAADLRPGQELDTPGNERAKINSNRRYGGSLRTFNPSVDSTHTYYVLAGETAVLVHNCSEDLYALEEHVAPRHLPGGLEADSTKSLFDAGRNLEELAEGSAGRIGIRQPETGNIRYFITSDRIIGTDLDGRPTNVYTIIRDGVDGELVMMHPGLPRNVAGVP